MELFNTLLYAHIAGGAVSLIMGSVVMYMPKANKRHTQLGSVFFYALLSSSMIGSVLAVMHENQFLFIVSIFTSYMLLSGRRALALSKIAEVGLYDWLLTGLMALFGLGFILMGAQLGLGGSSFGLVCVVFGIVSLGFVHRDYTNFKGRARFKNTFLITHIQRMVGSFIASSTAFLVVNNTLLPGVIAWLLPTVLMVPLIVLWSRKYGILKV
jgi:uncharacterized membrane protein